jgi:KUP system potassium uptake protein
MKEQLCRADARKMQAAERQARRSLLYPDWARFPIVMLATAATVIASQAVITGAYSLAHQAVQLGLLPRLRVRYASAERQGEIYVRAVNNTTLIGVLLMVSLFRSSSALASAYGIAVSGTMIATLCLAFVVIWKFWNWSLLLTACLVAPLLVLDATFFTANLLKVVEGAWVPLTVAIAISIVMLTWRRGTRLLAEKTRKLEIPLDSLVALLEKKPPLRLPGTAVFLTLDPHTAPRALTQMLEHFKVLYEDNVILTVAIANTPRVPITDRVEIKPIGISFSHVSVQFGYIEPPNIPRALAIARKLGWEFDITSTSFFLSRRLFNEGRLEMPTWQDRLFVALWRINADTATYFQIPSGRVIEIGSED